MSEAEQMFSTVYDVKDEELLKKLSEIAKVREEKKGSIFVRTGDPENNVFFLLSGVSRCFATRYDSDKTVLFIHNYGDIIRCTPSLEGAYAEYDEEMVIGGKLLCFSAADLVDIVKYYPEARMVYEKIISASLCARAEEKEMLYMDNNDRYRWFLKKYPKLISSVEHYKIASFLGMSPVTLSRIRSKIGNRD